MRTMTPPRHGPQPSRRLRELPRYRARVMLSAADWMGEAYKARCVPGHRGGGGGDAPSTTLLWEAELMAGVQMMILGKVRW